MSLFATLSAMVLTGAATPVSITHYKLFYEGAEWVALDPPAQGILVGPRVDMDTETVAFQGHMTLYVQDTRLDESLARVRFFGGDYNVVSWRQVDGVLVLNLMALREIGA